MRTLILDVIYNHLKKNARRGDERLFSKYCYIALNRLSSFTSEEKKYLFDLMTRHWSMKTIIKYAEKYRGEESIVDSMRLSTEEVANYLNRSLHSQSGPIYVINDNSNIEYIEPFSIT